MKITIEHEGTKIVVDEDGTNLTSDRTASMRWSDQNVQIQETIKIMTDQIIKLKQSVTNN